MSETAILPTLLAFATTVFGLSLFVQVLQEVYKYLSSSKSIAYVKALVDFIGPHAGELLKPGSISDLQLRGPFQFLRRRPTGHLQPMDQPQLVAALERTAAPWVRRTVDALQLEVDLQRGAARPSSPAVRELLGQLASVEPGAPGFSTAKEVERFLSTWLNGLESPGAPESLDAEGVLLAVKRRFLPLVTQVNTHFGQFTKNFELAYRRRNLRQTFFLGLGLAVFFQLPVNTLFESAAKVPLDQAIAAAEQLQAIHAAGAARDTTLERTPQELRDLLASINTELARTGSGFDLAFNFREVHARLGFNIALVEYLFWCLVTALLISFGAPFWNDLTGALLRLNRGAGPARSTPPEEPT